MKAERFRTRVAVLLVAGEGTRLRPLTLERPKALMDVGGETILGRAVRLLAAAGVERVVLATGYREDSVREAMAHAPAEVVFCRNPEYATTQNSVSLLHCRQAVGSEAFFKLDGDVVFRAEVLERLNACDAALGVAVDKRDGLGDEEMKVLVEGGRVVKFGKDIEPRIAAGESIGIERVSAELTDRLFDGIEQKVKRGGTDLYYEATYDSLVNEGAEARVVDVTDLAWTEVDTHEDLAFARQLVQAGKV